MTLYAEYRKERPHRQFFSKWKLFLLVALTASGLWGWFLVSDTNVLPIKSVVIQGTSERIDQQAVKRVLLIALKQNNFLTIKTDQVREQLLQIPWVGAAVVSREWPAKLVVRLDEQKVIARWNTEYLIGVDGSIIPMKVEQDYSHLPVLMGSEGQHQFVWKHYNQMNQALVSTGMKMAGLSLNSRHAWQAQLNNGVVLMLGRTDPLAKIHRAAKLYTKVIGSRGDEVEYVDLRYSNAIAVRWKEA
jgi:cell division protein FtsQ